ncbi:hypothetical protein TIFTF001_033401 [Ficus carica]|uniref:Uncharacterized protein n=1 Tax=Ficus carica TaxID=3494 RepID=A0AA88E1X5_FICCA|nr:hypothetical protein TIFTF001_033401 [Ficus carica]
MGSLDWLELAGTRRAVEHEAPDLAMPLVADMRTETFRIGRVRCTLQFGPPPHKYATEIGE